MAKYRLSYLGYGGYKSVDLEKLECLMGRKVTDIQVIDEFTTSFDSVEVLLAFLKRNKIIEDDVTKLVITVDKKENGVTINKKIYRGENLLLKSDKKFLDVSFVYKWIMANINNPDLMVDICNNYIEKYKNAYNRITGSSYILSLFSSLKALAYNVKEKTGDYIRPSELKEYENSVKEFINLEFYKVDKDVLIREGRIERKCEDNGVYKKSYRNIHDFIIFLKSLGIDLEKYKNSEIISTINSTFKIADNHTVEEQEEEEQEEFLTEDDVVRSNREFFRNYKEEPIDEADLNSGFGGNDYPYAMSRKELEDSLYDTGMSLVMKHGKGDLK